MNRAIAVGELHGPVEGLVALERIDQGQLEQYQPYYAARADLLSRAGRVDEATAAYDRALELTTNPAERRFLSRRRAAVAAFGADVTP
jgi:RNA polymerase sigma-70 factor (ECF subfamily)